MGFGHGSLDLIVLHMTRYFEGIRSAYINKKSEARYIGELPMTRRGWNLSFVEGKTFIAILTFEEHVAVGNEGGYTCSASQYPLIAGVDDPHEMARLLRLGEIIDSRPFPFQADWLQQARDSKISTPENEAAVKRAHEEGEAWGTQLATEHIAGTQPDFEEAKQRVTSVYRKLFELERGLRSFVEHRLEERHGSEWWDKASIPEALRGRVKGRQSDRSGFWLDDIEDSVLRFVDFGDLRTIIMNNKGAFTVILGPKERPTNWVVSVLTAMEPLRNRVGHVNILSADNEHDFYRDADRILAAIAPDDGKR